MTSSARHISAATAAALLGLPIAAAVAEQSGDAGASIREKLILSEASIKGLTESLAIANGESELFRRKCDDLETRIAALGIAPAGKESEVVRTRLLAAVRDMRQLQQERDASREQLVRLSESVLELLKQSDGIDAKSRLRVEEELRASSKLVSDKSAQTSDGPGLTSGSVVAVKPDLSLVVANLGASQGVKIGMPFQVWHGDRHIASVRVVDVRDAISGAVIQSTDKPSDTVQTGDALRVDTTR